MTGFYPIFLREMYLFRLRMFRPAFLFSMLISPLFYLLAFGFGLGKTVSVGGISYLHFLIPGIMAMSAMTSSFAGISSSLALGRLYHRSVDTLIVSPASTFDLAVGFILGGAVRGLFSSALFLLISIPAGMTFPTDPTFYLTWAGTLLLFSSLGTAVGFLAKSHEDTSMYSNYFILPMSFFSGTFFPLENLPTILRWIVELLPLTHSVKLMRGSMVGNPADPLSLLILAGFIGASFLFVRSAITRSVR